MRTAARILKTRKVERSANFRIQSKQSSLPSTGIVNYYHTLCRLSSILRTDLPASHAKNRSDSDESDFLLRMPGNQERHVEKTCVQLDVGRVVEEDSGEVFG